MATDPGDLVLDPTCGSGTTATVAEQWGRRWITIDTSRVALALARTRIMAARYTPTTCSPTAARAAPRKPASPASPRPKARCTGDLRQGFVYDRAPHVTLKSIANNAEIDVLWEDAQATLEPLRTALNAELNQSWEEWQANPPPRVARRRLVRRSAAPARRLVAGPHRPPGRDRRLHRPQARRRGAALRPPATRTRRASASPGRSRWSQLSPHRVVAVSMDEELVEELTPPAAPAPGRTPHGAAPATDFGAMILDHLRTAGVHQHQKIRQHPLHQPGPLARRHDLRRGHATPRGETERRAGHPDRPRVRHPRPAPTWSAPRARRQRPGSTC